MGTSIKKEIDDLKAKYSMCSIDLGGDYRLPFSVFIDELIAVVRVMVRREINTVGVFNQVLDSNDDCWSA